MLILYLSEAVSSMAERVYLMVKNTLAVVFSTKQHEFFPVLQSYPPKPGGCMHNAAGTGTGVKEFV